MDSEQWRTAWRVFEAACQLPEERRREYVESSTDPETVAEVLQMLEHFQQSPTLDEASALSAEPEPEEDEWPQLGRTVGRYKIDGILGRGGMGEVYSAEDPELGRRVALKFVSRGGAGTAGTVDRFIREARAASALNHPNVVTVHEVIRVGSSLAIVMELVEGEPLRAKCGTPRPVDQLSLWGRQVAEALAAAHARGIVHRDIKPENVILRSDGYVKVLDFGLARIVNTGNQTSSAGLPPGTLRYMSPEQASGDPATGASDVFALGIVLYELATGVHPFEARSPLAVAHNIVTNAAAPPSKTNPAIPAAFDPLVLAMLEKDPARRPNAEEVAQRLGQPFEATRPERTPPKGIVARIAAATLAVAVILAAIIFAIPLFRPPGRNSLQTAARLPKMVPFTTYEGSETAPSFSPDGQQIAFVWTGDDGLNGNIYVKAIGSEKLLRLTSNPTEELSPVWSPDGRQIAFLRRVAGNSAPLLMTVPAAGGVARAIGQMSNPEGYPGPIGWWPDSKSLILSDATPAGGALVRLFLDSREKRPLTHPPRLQADGLPVLSLDGRRIAFTRREVRAGSICLLEVASLQSQCVHRVESTGESVNGMIGGIAWQADGRGLLYADKTAIWRLNLDGRRPTVTRVLEGSFPFLTGDRQGRRLAFSKTYSDVNIWRNTLDGKHAERLAPSSEEDSEPQYSADASRILFRSRRTGSFEIFTCDPDGGHLLQVTSFGGHLGSPSWSPDGRSIAFDGYGSPADRDVKYTNIYVVPSSGGSARRLTADGGESYLPAWSPDGHWVYYILADGNRHETWKAPAEGGTPSELAQYAMFDLTESADGQYFYYTNHSGASGIWRRAVSGGEPVLINDTEGVQLFRYWALAKDGIYFIEGPANPILQFLNLTTQRVKRFGLVRKGIVRGPRGFAVSPDGSTILYTEEDLTLSDILLIENIL
jgi:serine/threonine protein kinase/Tol biopolymer transport system component